MANIIRVGFVSVLLLLSNQVLARDDGRYADSPLKPWFDQLHSKHGLCCSFADGMKVEDVDWDTGGPGGTFRVRLPDNWVIDGPMPDLPGVPPRYKPAPGTEYHFVPVPPDAVIEEPNRFGPAVVWPMIYSGKLNVIRCFIPGAGT